MSTKPLTFLLLLGKAVGLMHIACPNILCTHGECFMRCSPSAVACWLSSAPLVIRLSWANDSSLSWTFQLPDARSSDQNASQSGSAEVPAAVLTAPAQAEGLAGELQRRLGEHAPLVPHRAKFTSWMDLSSMHARWRRVHQ